MRDPRPKDRGSPKIPAGSPGEYRDFLVSGSCDLHAHTTASDGFLSPPALVAYARQKGLKAVAVCDHDTVSGIVSLALEGASAGRSPLSSIDGVEVVPGVELNSEWRGRELHILGYYVPHGPGPFRALLDNMQTSRHERVSRMVKKLEDLGVPVDLCRVLEVSAGDSVGRPHVARVMVEAGHVRTVREAFARYLGIGGPAYVERLHLSPEEAVRAIGDAGGVPVLAHPGTSHGFSHLRTLVESGLLGIEAHHPEHDSATTDKCLRVAAEYGLVATGGSDFHGVSTGEGGDLGSVAVPYAVVSTLKSLARIPPVT